MKSLAELKAEVLTVPCAYCANWPAQVPCCGVCNGAGELEYTAWEAMPKREKVAVLEREVARLTAENDQLRAALEALKGGAG